jgi:serine/threonine protein kinase
MARKHPHLEPNSHLDRFRLERLIGTGAFGQVWTAIDEGSHGFRKRVALKILAESKNPKRIEALMHEARICGALNHPNVIDVYGVSQVDNHTFIAMEFVEGETLSALWKDLDFLKVSFPRSIILDIGIAVCEALYHAWTAQDAAGQPLRIVHRDLKPANVMISDRGIVKVGDFGIAKASAIDPMTTRVGKLKGTPSYLAPEVWQGKRDFRPAMDLWSLGVILWEMVAMERFFGRAGMAEIFDLVSSRSPEREARQITPSFPQLGPIVQRLLQREPDDRYQSALKVADKLRRIRAEIGASGDLLQFSRLVRAGRLEPEHRQGSLIALPALPMEAVDWEPLISVAAGEGGPPTSLTESDAFVAPVKLAPVESGATPEGLTTSSAQQPVDIGPPPVEPTTEPEHEPLPPPPAAKKPQPKPEPPEEPAEAAATIPTDVVDPADIALPETPVTRPVIRAAEVPLVTDEVELPDGDPLPVKGPPWIAIAIFGVAAIVALALIIKTFVS